MATSNIRIIGILFPGFNIMDLTGPLEVFGNSQIPADARQVKIASATDVTTSSEGVSMKRDLSFIELLATQAGGITELSSYDVLVMPGAASIFLHAALDRDEGLVRVLQAFAQLQAEGNVPRWMLSVCSGAVFPGSAGLFDGKTVTTHWAYLDILKDVCMKAGTEVNVVRKRWCDAGKTDTGVRIVTAGGVSCGIDAALWITSEIYGVDKAATVSKAMDYDWKHGKVEVTDGWLV